jgi:iron(III) transport system substrate-binding protein
VYVDEFQKKFPEIKVDYQGANGSQQAPKLAAERQAGKFLADLYIGGATSPLRGLVPINAFDPIEEAFILPEVRDKSLWFQNHYAFEDKAGKYVLAFAGNGEATAIVRNTKMVRENELTKWSELLDPKWKGKIVSGDPSVLGTAVGNITDVAAEPQYGMEFIKKLYAKDHGIVLTADGRQLMDWIAQGQYPVGIGVPEFEEAKAVGLPVEQQPLDVVTLSHGFAHIMLVNQAPNPNAAKVFINWLLGKEAQTLYQRITTSEPSLRMDVPRDGLKPERVPDPKIKYVNTQHEDFVELRNDVAKQIQALRS